MKFHLLYRFYKPVFITVLLFSSFLLNACSRLTVNNQALKVNLAYSEEQAALVREIIKINQRDKRFRNINFIKVEQSKAPKLLKTNAVDAYLGSMLDESSGSYLNKNLIAKDGLVIIVNPRNPLRNIDLDMFSEIFLKGINNWKALGLEDRAIIFINKNNTNENRLFLESFFKKSVTQNSTNQFEVNNDNEAIDLVQQYEHSISYISFSSITNRVNAVHVDHIAPTQLNISSGNFPIYKPISIYESDKLLTQSNKRNLIEDLLNFLWSADAVSVIKSAGFIPLSAAEIEVIKYESLPLILGVSAPLSGTYSELGRAIVNGAKIAVLEANENRLKNHKRIELMICDDKAELSKGLDCANMFIKNKAFGVVGHLNSLISIEASKLYMENNIVQISPGSSHPWLTETEEAKGKVFRTINIDENQAEKIASAISKLKNQKKERILVLHNGTIYGSHLATLIENFILRYLGKDVALESQSFNVNDSRYHLQLKSSIPDIIVFIGEYADAAQMLVDLALDNKSGITFFGADGNFSKRFIDLAGLKAEGAYVIGCNLDQTSPSYKSFEKRYQELFHSNISSFSIYSYDASRILINSVQILNQNETETGKSLGELISESKTESYCGEINFNEKGDPQQSRLAVFKVKNGKFIKTNL